MQELIEIARRLGALPADKRKLFIARLEERGIDLGVLPIVAGGRPARIPLSYAQQRLWIADQLAPDAALYNLTTTLRLRGPLDRDALARALDGLIARHEALRTGFIADAGTPWQVVAPAAPIAIRVVDVRDLSPHDRIGRARALAAEDAVTPFDLAHAPLLRAQLVALAADEHWLILTMHHLISDEWSNEILVGELVQLYAAAPLAPLAVQYADYALWQRAWLEGAAVRRQLAYWRAELGTGAYELALPTDAPRPLAPASTGAAHVITFGAALKDRLHQLARRCDATLFMTVLAGFQILLARTAGQDEVRVGVPIANRHRPEVDGVVGFFANTQVLRGIVRGPDSVIDHVRAVRRGVLEAQANQDLPFDHLVEALSPERRANRNPLFEVMLSWHRAAQTRIELRGGLAVDWEVPDERVAKFDLCLHATDTAEGIACELVYRSDLFQASTIERMAARLEVVLDQMARHAERPLAALDWLVADDHAAIAAWTAPEPQPAVPSVHAWIAEHAVARPDAIAVRAGDDAVTWRALEARANALAGRLREVGVGIESRVALGLGRSIDFVVAVYATLKCGAAYVPLDPGQPEARLAAMIRDSAAIAVIAPPALRARVAADAAWIDPSDIRTTTTAVINQAVPPTAAAYILYTSGSTGQPKGVVVSHDNLATYVRGLLDRLALPAGASMAMVSTVAADLGNTTLFGALCAGATLHLIRETEAFDADAMGALMTAHAVDVLKIVPSHLKGLLQATHPGRALPRHTLIVGGEATDWPLVDRIAALGACRIVNHYGPTETTVGVLTHAHDGDRRASATLPLGLPLPGRTVHVLDRDLRPLPAGVVGEIFIGGAGVARGYAGQPGLTADRFVPDPFTAPGDRMYRTGDRARRLADGRIEFLGRGDGQIKLRGHRIELGEIQAALLQVTAATGAELAITETTAGHPQLTAFLLGDAEPDAAVRERLAAHLPAHMIPAELLWLARFPVTANGKLDRAALASLRTITSRSDDRAQPRTDVEHALAAIWAGALERDPADLGVHDNFFQLGGDSLLAFQVVAAARAAGLALAPRDLLDHQTIDQLARVLADRAHAPVTPAGPALVAIPRTGALPASFAQARLWFLWQLEPESTAYHAPIALRLTGALDLAALRRAFAQLAQRHEILRTRLVEIEGNVQQIIDPASSPVIDVIATREADASDLAAALAAQPFDLERGPLWRAHVLALADDDHVLVVVFHHVISDGWSTRVLTREFAQLYAGHTLPPLAIQYADYAAWQRRWLAAGEQARQLAYWRDQLGAEHPVLELPTDRTRPAIASHRGATMPITIGPTRSAQLTALAHACDATVFMVLLAAWSAVLARFTGQSDVRIGVPNANRHRAELDGQLGLFVNTQVLRTEVAASDRFTALVARVKATTLGALAHQDLPFEQLVEALAPARSLSVSPLFQVMYNHQRRDLAALDQLAGLRVAPLDVEHHVAAFDLVLDTWEVDGALDGALTYATDLFDAQTIARIAAAYERVLAAIVRAPDTQLTRLPVITRDDTRAIGPAEPLDPRSLHLRIVEQAVRTPDRIAVRHADRTLTYAELVDRASRLAARLPVRPGDLVGLAVERSDHLVTAALAILLTGAAYLPIDPDYPADRIAFMLDDARPRVLVTTATLADRFADHPRVLVDDLAAAPLTPAHTHPADLAYVIYTSGSTGRPKGVAISHAAITNFLDAMAREVPLAPTDRVLALTPISFDIAGLELFLPLVSGAAIVVADRAEATDPSLLLARIRTDEITVVQATPATWRMVTADPRAASPHSGLSTIRALTGGEALPPDLATTLRHLTHSLHNVYGPTETTVWSAIARLDTAHPAPVLGDPLRNTQLYLLDPALQPVPLGVPGELFIAGHGLARGYLRRPALTADRFVPDPFGAPGARMYRTGDRVRRRPDGNLDFLGRIDHQIKLRGHRIELGEIEAHLLAATEVRAAVVVVRDDRLVAYVGPTDDAALDPAALRAALAAHLPEIMVPSHIVVLDDLPRTPAGKLDRKALPAPDASDAAAYLAPRDALEHQLAAIWAAALDRAEVGLGDHFFELGGHSLLAARVTARILRDLGVAVPLRALFEAPRLAAFADRVRGLIISAAPTIAIPRADRAHRLPLSFAQERQWLLWQLEPDSRAYHMPAAVEIVGALNPAALDAAFTQLVARHEILRTHFAADGDGLAQIIAPAAPVAIARAAPDAMRAFLDERFDLARGPLWRAQRFQLADDRHVLAIVVHHAIADEVSMHVVLDELTAALAGTTLAQPALQYADYAAWQRRELTGDELARQLAYWTSRLGDDHPVIDWPADRARPAIPSGRGGAFDLALNADATRALRRVARALDASLFHVVLAAFTVWLSRITGQRDVRIGVPSANRDRVELERLIGLFVNTHVLRTEIAAGDRFAAIVARVKDAALGAHAHADLPFEQLVEALRPPRSLAITPLFQVLFNHVEAPATAPAHLKPWPLARDTAQFDLSVDSTIVDDALVTTWTFARDLFDDSTIARLAEGFRQLVLDVAHGGHVARIDQLAVLAPADRHAIVDDWNATARDHQLDLGFAARFAARAAATPDAIAARQPGASITYRALASRAHRVARTLQSHGVQIGDRIGVLADRGIDQLALITGVLAAGAVYVALDVRHPDDRITQITRASAARLVLTTRRNHPALASIAALVADDLFAADVADHPLDLPTHPDQLAYVLFTSGSTGTPKGAMVSLAGMLNNQLSKIPFFVLSDTDVIAQTAAPSFDISVWQLLTGLLSGAIIDFVPDDTVADPRALARHLRASGATIAELVPALVHELLREPDLDLPSLRFLLPTGEALPPELARHWLRRFPHIPLVNAYGPAECADDVALARISSPPPADTLRMSIGRPTDNTRLFVLDASLSPVPVGVTGQLAVAGVGVGHGYLADPARTAAVFVPNPFGAPGERMYLTGDLARLRPDLDLEYVGRVDHQIKLRGHRIELGEIEARLAVLPGVDQAVVALHRDRLVAYTTGTASADDLRARLAAALPAAMVPAHFVHLPALPRSPNGKIDRRALPAPDLTDAARAFVAPRSPLESHLARIWADVLTVDRVGIDDNFFALGGHSLLATRVTARVLAELDLELPLRTIFEAPTLAAFAARVATASPTDAAPILVADRALPLALSFAQERQYFLWRLEPESTAYHIPLVAELTGPLDLTALRAAFAALITRHEALRTRFVESADGVHQVIEPELPIAIPLVDSLDLDALIATPFDLTTGPSWRAAVHRIATDRHALVVVIHHIVADDVSLRILIDEFAALYAGAPLAPLPLHYADYAAWQRAWLTGDERARQLAHWTAHLGTDHPVIELPTDRPRPAVATGRGALVELRLDAELTAALHALARAHDATLFMVLHAGFVAVLHRLTGQTDLRIGVPHANRTRLALERVIGFFINTHVLRSELDPRAPFTRLLADVRASALAAQAHADLPFEQLVEALRPARSLSHSPLFQVMFNFLGAAPDQARAIDGLAITPLAHARTTTQFDLALDTWETDGAIHGALTYATDLFDPPTIDRIVACLIAALGAIATRPATAIALLPLPSDEVAFAHGPSPAPDPRGVDEVIADQIVRTPDNIAVRHAGTDLTYAALGRRAHRLAHRLRALGVGADTLVAICLERTHRLVPSVLGVLQAGGAYLPIDPAYPVDRITYMLADAHPAVLVTEPALAARFADAGVPLCIVDDVEAITAPPPVRGLPARLAYCIYTSGSTGRPKGSANTHAALVTLLDAMRGHLAATDGDRMLALAPFSFDIATLELLLPLTIGARVVLASRAEALDPALLLDRVRTDGVTIMQATPATWRMVMTDPRASEILRGVRLLSGGEFLPRDLADQLIAIHGAMVNAYGPTETTIYSTAQTLTPGMPLNVGGPFAHTTAYILDRFLQPVPTGVVGEVYHGGVLLARGYRHRPGLTAERFVPDPFGSGGRLYRTGDLARRHADGVIEIVGRADHQVKLRGYRIELGEIEARLLAQPAIAAAAVLLREDAPGEKRLVAYVVPANDVLDLAAITAALRNDLPEFMIPAHVVEIAALPRTANGKLDRKALPAPDVTGGQAAYVAPRTPLARQLARIWADALAVDRIGLEDSFFDLGGHSLLATKITSRVLAELAIAVPLRALFEAPRLGAFAARVAALTGAPVAPPITTVDRAAPLALSFAQERQWFLAQLEPDATAYHIPFAVELTGALDPGALARAFSALAARHEALRTRLVETAGAVHQVIDPPRPIALTVEPTDEAGVRAAIAAELALPFDLARGPLWRVRVLQLAVDRHVLFVVLHHAIADDASLRILIDELAALYISAPLAPLAIQYADYAAWQRAWLTGDERARQLTHWLGHLGADHPVIELPTDRPRPAIASAHGAAHPLRFDATLTRAIDQLARRHGATMFMTLLAAFDAWLSRITGQRDVRVGVPVTHRQRLELEPLIGFFVNTHVLRADVAPTASFTALLADVKHAALAAQAHADLPFEQLVDAIKPARSLSHSPLFQVMFNFLGSGLGAAPPTGLSINPDPYRRDRRSSPGEADRQREGIERFHPSAPRALGDLAVTPIDLPHTTTQLDLNLAMWSEGDELHGLLTYATDLFDAQTIDRMIDQLTHLVRAIIAAPDAPIATLAMLAHDETRAIGPAEPLDPRGLHLRIVDQAVRTPDHIAVTYAGRSLTYAALVDRASRLAARLPVGPGDLVGLAVERSDHLVTAALAILLAGAAYLPIDPDYPADRIAFMLDDAQPALVVTTHTLADRFADHPRVLVDDLAAAPIAPVPTHPADLAYVIYTSGSTGRPKGVAISHAAITNFLDAMAREVPLGPADRVLALTPISFDIAGLELFLPLVSGAAIVVADRAEATDPSLLLARIRTDAVTVVQATPATWRMVTADPRVPETLAPIRALTGGEALPPDLATTLRHLTHSLHNVYGPTETTVWSAIARLDAAHPSPVLGDPLRNTQLYLLDPALQPVPLGVPGELFIAGHGLARGYLRRPALTADRFVPDPFGRPGARMYRTGDRVRRRSDGNLDFLGRIDHQIKLRGHRIELGEIEARLLDLPEIAAAAVVLREDVAGDPRLVAYIVRQPDTATVDVPAALRHTLPDFMIPAHIVELAALPRSPAGKLDRKALPAPDASRPRDLVPPRDDLERRLAALWRDVLDLAEVGIHDSFFDLGGHSLSATRLASRIRDELAIELPLRVLFEATTVAALADALRGGAFGAISHDEVDAMSDLLDLLENPQ